MAHLWLIYLVKVVIFPSYVNVYQKGNLWIPSYQYRTFLSGYPAHPKKLVLRNLSDLSTSGGPAVATGSGNPRRKFLKWRFIAGKIEPVDTLKRIKKEFIPNYQ